MTQRGFLDAYAPPPQVAEAAVQFQVSNLHVRALLEAAERAGVRAERVYERARITPQAAQDPYGTLPLEVLDALICATVELTGDPAFGIHWAERSPMLGYDVVMLMMAQAPTLREGLESLLRCQAVLGAHREFRLTESAFSVALEAHPLATSTVALHVRSELAMAGYVRLLQYAGADLNRHVHNVSFAFQRPAHAAEHTRAFGRSCRYGRAVTSIEIDRCLLDRPLPHANHELHQLLLAQAERVRERVENRVTLTEQLRGQLRVSLKAPPSMPRVARSLGMSERSLRRRLTDEGVSYSQLLRDLQCEVAQILLCDRRQSIRGVALETGFRSMSAFNRAFKRNFGKTPGAFRAGARVEPRA